MDAASAEGAYRVTARSGRLTATVPITVESPDLSGLIAATEHGDRGTGGGSDPGSASSGQAAGVAAQAQQGRPPWVWVVLILLALLLFVVIIAAIVVTRRRHRQAEAAHKEGAARAAQIPDGTPQGGAAAVGTTGASAPPPEPLFCPECGKRAEEGQGFCAAHGKQMVVLAEAEVRQRGMICPKCRRGYGAEADFCPHDRAPLVPYPRFQAEHRDTTQRKTCPECGTSYPAETTFCGKDGTSLA